MKKLMIVLVWALGAVFGNCGEVTVTEEGDSKLVWVAQADGGVRVFQAFQVDYCKLAEAAISDAKIIGATAVTAGEVWPACKTAKTSPVWHFTEVSTLPEDPMRTMTDLVFKAANRKVTQ